MSAAMVEDRNVATYTIQVSNHVGRSGVGQGGTLPTAAGEASWQTVYDGPIATASEARATVDRLSAMYRHVRAFKGANVGRLFYGVLR